MLKILMVGSGGFIGSVGRYLLGLWVYQNSGQHWFPYATLTVNVIGCFLIGLWGGILETRHAFSDELQLFLLVGFLGGFTTFSSFSHETNQLLRNSQVFAAGLNVVLQIVLCLLFAWLGHQISRQF